MEDMPTLKHRLGRVLLHCLIADTALKRLLLRFLGLRGFGRFGLGLDGEGHCWRGVERKL